MKLSLSLRPHIASRGLHQFHGETRGKFPEQRGARSGVCLQQVRRVLQRAADANEKPGERLHSCAQQRVMER